MVDRRLGGGGSHQSPATGRLPQERTGGSHLTVTRLAEKNNDHASARRIQNCSEIATWVIFVSILLCRHSFATEDRKLDIPVPLNEDVLGIRIPYYTEQGRLDIQFDAQVARKTDENHTTLNNLKISLFEENNDAMTVEMPKGILNLQTNILSGNNGVHIKRSDLTINAESIVFETKERFARFKGKVSMTILNLDLTNHDSKSSPK